MDQYLNSTHECTPEEIDQTLIQSIRAHLVTYGIEDILTKEPTLCIETTAQIVKQGLFAGKPTVTLHADILTDHWLVTASLPEGKTPGVISARYSDITAQDYENTAEYKLIPNCGLDVFGIHANSEQGAGSIFIPLGPEPAAQKFRIILKDLIARSL
jgi:hypothetical protein